MKKLLMVVIALLPNHAISAKCESNLDDLVTAISTDDAKLKTYTSEHFYLTEQLLDPERRPVSRHTLDAAAASRKYGRLFPSKDQQMRRGLSYSFGPAVLKDKRGYAETGPDGWIGNNYWFYRKNGCWELASRDIFIHANKDDMAKVAEADRILSAEMVAVPNMSTPLERLPLNSVRGKAESDLRILNSALRLFRIDTGRYPTLNEGIRALVGGTDVNKPEGYSIHGYLSEKALDIKDPWGREYRYSIEPCPHFVSYGEDGRDGGKGPTSDIGGCLAP
jgi:type II secretion system protein G